MLYGLKTILHNSRAVLAFNGGLMIALDAAFGSCQSSSHSQFFRIFWETKLPPLLPLHCEKSWALDVYLLGWCCFPVRTARNILLKGYFSLLQQVFFSCLGLCCTQGSLNRQASPYSCLSFSVPCHYYHFLSPPDAIKNNTRTKAQI